MYLAIEPIRIFEKKGIWWCDIHLLGEFCEIPFTTLVQRISRDYQYSGKFFQSSIIACIFLISLLVHKILLFPLITSCFSNS